MNSNAFLKNHYLGYTFTDAVRKFDRTNTINPLTAKHRINANVIEFLSLFVNFENFTDTRQSRWGAMCTGNIQNPQFAEIYAPTDGFVANAGFRLRF